MVGLPIAEGVLCTVSSYNDKITIEGSGNKFNLDKNKLLDVTIKTNTEIEKSYISSAGGAVGGALLFGPLGAMIGGRTKTKESKIITSYLIFTYDKNGETQYIAFNINTDFSARKFVDEFQKIENKLIKEIDL
jgi:hypothetical protein